MVNEKINKTKTLKLWDVVAISLKEINLRNNVIYKLIYTYINWRIKRKLI